MSARRPTPVPRHWQVRCVQPAEGAPDDIVAATITATVPGHLHTDLQTQGLISDPLTGDGEEAQRWVGRSRWEYTCAVEGPVRRDGDRVDLVAEGIDTFAAVLVNGEPIGTTDDQHLAYRWHVAPSLHPGENTLTVAFDSAFAVADAVEHEIGVLPRPYPDPYPYVRKMACNFGWDWGPRVTSLGIWQPMYLETWRVARIDAVRPQVSVTGASTDAPKASVTVYVDLVIDPDTTSDSLTVSAQVLDPDGVCVARGSHDVHLLAVDATTGEHDVAVASRVLLEIPDPQLWWPTGLGSQPLYDLDVVVTAAEEVIDTAHRRIGLRSVRIDERPNGSGTRFAIVVNGRRIRVRGYNWIPDLPFANEVTDKRLRTRLDQAVSGGANLLRVWGGGHFASEDFLDGCDERGLLVWHDFPFACAAYSEDDTTVANVRTEAEQAVSRMAAHPSLVLWCGGNECVWGWHDWGWTEQLGDRPWGARYFTSVLPEVVQRLDPGRPYLPNSPWSGSIEKHPEDQRSGVVHIWTVWNDEDWTHYRDWDPRFVAEMGWCAPATHATMRAAIPSGELLPVNPAIQHHMRAFDGMQKLARGLQPHFDQPQDSDTWLFLTQLNQARALAAGVEWLRSRSDCTGVVLWQLNDCWPALSWATVDVNGLAKPAWFAVRRSFAPRLVTLQPTHVGDRWGDGGLSAHAVNDSTSAWRTDVHVRRLHVDGSELARETIELHAPVDGTSHARIGATVAAPSRRDAELIVADADGQRSVWFFVPDREMVPVRPVLDASVRPEGEDVIVTVAAQTLVRDLTLLPDRAAAAFDADPTLVDVDTMLLTLLPGERAEIRLSGLSNVDTDELAKRLTTPPVLRWLADRR